MQRLSVRYPAFNSVAIAAMLAVPHEPTRRRTLLRAYRDGNTAFNRGDFEAAFAPLDAHVEFHLPPVFPGAEVLRGRAAVIDYYRDAHSEWDDVHLWTPEIKHASARSIVSTYSLVFRGSETGLGFEMHGTQSADVRRGRIVRVAGTVDTSRAL
jgi:ketosteroid isomerase-like protein